MNFQQLVTETLSPSKLAGLSEPSRSATFAKDEWAMVRDHLGGRWAPYRDRAGKVILQHTPYMGKVRFVLEFDDGDKEWFSIDALKGPFDDKETAEKFKGDKEPSHTDLVQRVGKRIEKRLQAPKFTFSDLKQHVIDLGFDIDWENPIETPYEKGSFFTTKTPTLIVIKREQGKDKYGNEQAAFITWRIISLNPFASAGFRPDSNLAEQLTWNIEKVVKLPSKRMSPEKREILDFLHNIPVDWNKPFDYISYAKQFIEKDGRLDFWKEFQISYRKWESEFPSLHVCNDGLDLNRYFVDERGANSNLRIVFGGTEDKNVASVPHSIFIDRKLEIDFQNPNVSTCTNALKGLKKIEAKSISIGIYMGAKKGTDKIIKAIIDFVKPAAGGIPIEFKEEELEHAYKAEISDRQLSKELGIKNSDGTDGSLNDIFDL